MKGEEETIRTVEIDDEEKLAAIIASIPADAPIVMLNLLRFHDVADYQVDSGIGALLRWALGAEESIRTVGKFHDDI